MLEIVTPVWEVVKQMSSKSHSIFDLSPSEKLQFVEDLWDDLASSPDKVPVFEWQIEELERRKNNLTALPASALDWEDLKRRVRNQYAR